MKRFADKVHKNTNYFDIFNKFDKTNSGIVSLS